MSIGQDCPCVNVTCPNHGDCARCISRHARIGTLNYCSLYTVLPVLQQAIEADPESPAAAVLRGIVDRRLEVNAELMRKHGLTEAGQEERRKKVADYSDY